MVELRSSMTRTDRFGDRNRPNLGGNHGPPRFPYPRRGEPEKYLGPSQSPAATQRGESKISSIDYIKRILIKSLEVGRLSLYPLRLSFE
jgi:hypothetical protein